MLHNNLNQCIMLGDFLHLTSQFDSETIIKPDIAFIGVYDKNGSYLGYIDVLSETFHESK